MVERLPLDFAPDAPNRGRCAALTVGDTTSDSNASNRLRTPCGSWTC
jgi:hypothetical protein